MKSCITVSYGRVKGKAKQYQYWEACIYDEYTTKRGKLVWKLRCNCGCVRRSYRLAVEDALQLSFEKNIPYLEGIRQYQEVKNKCA